MDILWEGMSEFRAALDAIVARQLAASREALTLSAHEVERQAKAQLSQTSHPKRTPTPSRPGDPPSLVSGALRRSVTVKGPTAVGPQSWEAQVGGTVVYARIQELGGTTGRGHMTELPPRPYMKPALDAAQEFIAEAFRKAWSYRG